MSTTDSEVPVVLFVFNRPKQVLKVLECLRKNNIPKLLVFSDGPRGDHDEAAISEVRAIIDAVDWVPVVKTYRPKNVGLNSIPKSLNEVFEKHDRAIIIEDDICVSPEFYSFACACLEKYKDDPEIAGITGLRYPFSKKNLGSDSYDGFFTPRVSSWGWATWAREWKTLSFDGKKLVQSLRTKKSSLDLGGVDLPYAADEIFAGRLVGAWDVEIYLNMLLNKQCFISPKYNMVMNIGLAGGSHANIDNEPSWRLRWEKIPSGKNTWQLPPAGKVNPAILADFLEFFKPENLERVSMRRRARRVYRRSKSYLSRTVG